jgi:16S rRNA (adenine1518-N6/adenine1519-N6)-dimethyltransferase
MELSAVADAPRQASLRRLRRFGVRPDRELGQNFLVDDNILGVIARAAALRGEDAVLEIGGGLGVLSEYLAERVAHVHVVEIDERLREALDDAVGARANVSVQWGDAMRLPLAQLRPRPGKVVANLPYGIAAGVLLRTIEELPSVSVWVAMVQREVGERLAAAPASRVYGVSSVLAQLSCEVELLRVLPRSIFYPAPHVDSALVRLRRRQQTARVVTPQLHALVTGAFAHRRKTLAGSLALEGVCAASREQVRDALVALSHPPDARAERLTADDFRALAALLAR